MAADESQGTECTTVDAGSPKVVRFARRLPSARRDESYIRLPSFEQVTGLPTEQ